MKKINLQYLIEIYFRKVILTAAWNIDQIKVKLEERRTIKRKILEIAWVRTDSFLKNFPQYIMWILTCRLFISIYMYLILYVFTRTVITHYVANIYE